VCALQKSIGSWSAFSLQIFGFKFHESRGASFLAGTEQTYHTTWDKQNILHLEQGTPIILKQLPPSFLLRFWFLYDYPEHLAHLSYRLKEAFLHVLP